MKLLNEYLERAISLQAMAAEEPDSRFKQGLLEQAGAYRKLAAKRAKKTAYRPQAPQKARPNRAIVG
jgi:hypothetical protein